MTAEKRDRVLAELIKLRVEVKAAQVEVDRAKCNRPNGTTRDSRDPKLSKVGS